MSISHDIRRTLIVVLALNALVTLMKIYVGVHTQTLTVVGAALESGLDMMNNVIALTLVGIAHRAPDEEHPYGHAKFETLGALAVVGFLSISCFELLRRGADALVGGGPSAVHRASFSDIGIVAVTLAINAFVVWYEGKRGRELKSALLTADAAHTQSDILVTLLAIVSLWLSSRGAMRVDGALAIVVGLIIAYTGYQILRMSIPVLVDERAVEAAQIRTVAEAVPGVLSVRNIRSRATATHSFAEVTISVSGLSSVAEAHELADAVEDAVSKRLGGGQVTVHVEPA
ncbi:MAG TPA: cation diffusion facilitator family transporter [Gemmatimonadaceae bacterium]|nr:cation diffusion facilitator family transporter [Gemmatimonadaceae bacterium]